MTPGVVHGRRARTPEGAHDDGAQPSGAHQAGGDRPQEVGPARQTSRLELILAIEAAARASASLPELAHLIATDTRPIAPGAQVVVFRLRGKAARIVAVSNLSSVERTSPLVQDLEQVLSRRARGMTGSSERATLDDLRDGDAMRLQDMAFSHFALLPFRMRGGPCFGGMLLARAEPWSERDIPVLERLAGAFGHAWAALERPARQLHAPGWRRFVLPACVLAAAAAGAVPVPLTALAPAEVIAREPAYVTAPLDGVIRGIEVAPNARVEAGDVILRFVDTAIGSRLEVAERAVEVAQAKEQRLVQAAFADRNARRDLAVAAADLRLALAERNAAAEQLARTVVRADRSGIAVYGSRKEWEGRPVATGERIMQIAAPDAVQIRIEMPVKDAALVRENARVRVYLDADPLRPLDGGLTQATYHATPVPGGGLAFSLVATLDARQPSPRIGHRGTAQVFGDPVPLGYYVLRRPLTALRQMVGL